MATISKALWKRNLKTNQLDNDVIMFRQFQVYT